MGGRLTLAGMMVCLHAIAVAGSAHGQCSPSGLGDTQDDTSTAITFRAHFTNDSTTDVDYFTAAQATACVNGAADAYDAFHLYLFADPYQNGLDSSGTFHTYIYNIGGVATAYANCFTLDAPNYLNAPANCIADVTTHELFHTVQRRYMCAVPVDCTDDNVSVSGTFGDWVAEGQAQMMMDHVSSALDGLATTSCTATSSSTSMHAGFLDSVRNGSSSVASPLQSPQTSLLDLSYSACLFWKYCCEKHSVVEAEPYSGIDFIREFWDQAASAGTNNSLAHLHNAIVDGGGKSISDTWQDYAICNYTKDFDVTALPDWERWYYVDENQYGEGTYGSVAPARVNFGDGILNSTQDAYSIRYYEADFTPGTCAAVGVAGDSSASVGWALVGINTNGEAVALSRQQGREYGRVFLASPATDVTRIGAIVATLSNDTGHNIEFDSGNLTLTIKSPTNALPAYPGLASDPGRFLVRVLVEGPDGLTPDGPDSLSVLGLEAADFVVMVGGMPATVHSAGYVGGEYWLVVQAPAQAVDGKYNLSVSLCNGSTGAAVIDGVEYGDILVNHMIVIDVSGSMDVPSSPMSKLEAAQNAATMYVDSVPDDDRFGVVFFSGDGSECNDDATLLSDLDWATEAKRWLTNLFILALTADDKTSIGDGLWMAQDRIEGVPPADINAITLLSDGNENEGRFWYDPNPSCPASEGPVRDRFLTASTIINALSFGQEADQSLMQDIAEDTGGVHDYIPVEGSGSRSTLRGTTDLSMANRLAVSYIDALANARDLEKIFGDYGDVGPGYVDVTIPFTESGLADVSFIFNVDSSSATLSVELRDPSGHLITDPVDASIYSNSSQTHTVIHLHGSPMAGDWTARLTVADVAQYLVAVIGVNRHGAELEFAMYQFRNGGLDGIPERGLYEQGVPMHFVAMPTDKVGAILDATITARIELPDGRIACGDYQLRDDGKSADGEADDGVYGLVFTETAQGSREGVDNDDRPGGFDPDSGDPGTYTVTIRAVGVTNFGESFLREIVTGFHIFASVEDGDSDGLPDTWEIHYDTDPNSANASEDSDLDGLSNGEELENGTHPFCSDTDVDGESDKSELDAGRCPFDPADGALSCPLDVAVLVDRPDDDEKTPVEPETLLIRFPWESRYAKLRIERAVDAPTGFALHDVLPRPEGELGTYVDVGLDGGRRYFYRFQAETAAGGRSRYSRIVSGAPECSLDVNDDCDANGAGDSCELDGADGQAYGFPATVQDTQTQFGDSSLGQVDFADGSELDAGYATIRGDVLYLLLAGNLESNFNKLDIFIDSIAGEGQNRLLANNPNVDFDGLNRMGDDGSGNGLTFDAGFAPDFWLSFTGGNDPYKFFGNYAELLTAGGGEGYYLGSNGVADSGTLSGGRNPDWIRATIDNSNTNGVTAGTGLSSGEGVTTGVELVVPLAAIGTPAGAVRICAFINGVAHDYVSNQVLGPIGGGPNLGEPRDVDFNIIPGDQSFTAQRARDCDSNGLADVCEFAHGVAADCNTNGIVDACDVGGGTSNDTDSNGVPDECNGGDCNTNGIPDALDLAMGTGADCNSNGILDECEELTVETLWTCGTGSWSTTGCWSVLGGGSYPSNDCMEYSVTLPGGPYTVTVDPAEVTVSRITAGGAATTLEVTPGASLTIADSLTARGTLLSRGTLRVDDTAAPVDVGACDLIADAGGSIELPIGNYAGSAGGDSEVLRASLGGSYLGLPNLTAIDGSADGQVLIHASHGATVDLPSLTTVLNNVSLAVENDLAVLNCPNLDRLPPGNEILVENGATLIGAPFVDLGGVSTTIRGGTTVFDTSAVANLDDGTLWIDGGAVVSFPSVATYTAGALDCESDSLRAKNPGSALVLPSLAGIDAGACGYVRVRGQTGGRVLMPALRSMSGQIQAWADGAGGLVEMGMVDLESSGWIQIQTGGEMRVHGSLSYAMSNPARFAFNGGTLTMAGDSAYGSCARLEVAGEDVGDDPSGWVDNFQIDRLVIGAGANVRLVDGVDNGNRFGGTPEALYVDTLEFTDADGRLWLGGINIYYGILVGSAAQVITSGDSDGDCDVDLDDHDLFVDCLAGPNMTPDPTPPATALQCLDAFDKDGDNDVDLVDFKELSIAFTGSAG